MPYVSNSLGFGFYTRREANLTRGLLCVLNDAQCPGISEETSIFLTFRLLHPPLFTLVIC
jgi:hypothetical protein